MLSRAKKNKTRRHTSPSSVVIYTRAVRSVISSDNH